MLLRELFEAGESIGIIFGRFNPPHQGHKAAWEEAAKNTHWYVGTNQSTQGPKDPLPFEIKIQAMQTIWPNIKGHIIPEQTWWSLAAAVYKKHGEIDLKVITDETDAKVFVPGLQKQNGVEGRHGFYKFSSIEWQPAPRVSSATELRAAVANDDPKAFAKAAGVPADTKVAGKPFFDLVKYYLGQQTNEGAMKRIATSQSNKVDRTASSNKLQPGLDTFKKKPDSKKKISEGFKLQLERGKDMDVLHIVNTDTGGRTEVRGKKGYESGNYDANDQLHQLLDRLGKSVDISQLMNGEPVGINPKHPHGAKAKAATDVAYNESTDLNSLRKFVKSQREAPDQVLYQMMMAPDTYGHSASNFVRSWYEKTKEENGLNDVDSALEIMVDKLGLNENFADGKKKGKSRPGRVKRAGASCNGSVTALRKRAKNSSGEKARMYHWCANMKSGRKKK